MHAADDGDDAAEDEYQVERIQKVRFRGGRKEFFLKWKGYSEEENTWEPETNLDCPELIKEFEDRMARERATRSPIATPTTSTRGRIKPTTPTAAISSTAGEDSEPSSDSGKPRKRSQPPSEVDDQVEPTSTKSKRTSNDEPSKSATSTVKPRGFARSLQPDRIIGATDSSGELMFLIKWKDSNEADLVPAREANVKCPQVVIRFYEERLTWHTPEPRASANVVPTYASAAPSVEAAPSQSDTTAVAQN